jgi:hypothetical protein
VERLAQATLASGCVAGESKCRPYPQEGDCLMYGDYVSYFWGPNVWDGNRASVRRLSRDVDLQPQLVRVSTGRKLESGPFTATELRSTTQ